MKTVEELRLMMKDSRYSGHIHERDPEFIRQVEQGFKALFPLRECHPEKIPEEICMERDARVAQRTAVTKSLDETKNHRTSLELQTNEIEQTGDLKKLRKHLLLLEEDKLYLDILSGRRVVIDKLLAEANQRYREALEMSHDCSGCRYLMKQHQETMCAHGWEVGKRPRPTAEVDKCPDPTGQMFDHERPFIRREPKELPPQGVG